MSDNIITGKNLLKLGEMHKKTLSLTKGERMYLFDMGVYNDIVKGYLILAMRHSNFTEADIKRALDGIDWALSELPALDASDIKI